MFSANPNKIAFAHILRGVAVLMVAYRHLFQSYWLLPHEAKGALLGAKHFILHHEQMNPKPLATIFTFSGMSIGAIGVGIFFILSGFVISFSVEKRSRWYFFLNRLIRIFPVIWIALLFDVGLFYAYTDWYLGTPSKGDWWGYIENATLIFRILHNNQYIDIVIWTLEIEVLFYVAIALIGKSILNKPLIFCLSVIMLVALRNGADLGLEVFSNEGLLFNLLSFLNASLPHILMMYIGILFYVLYKKRWNNRKIVFSFGLVSLCLLFWLFAGPRHEFTFSYVAALAIWTLFYVYQNHLNRCFHPLYLLGTVSFSFYLFHQFPGFIFMSISMAKGLHPYLASSLAMLLSLLLSSIIYVCIEKRFATLSQKVSIKSRFKLASLYQPFIDSLPSNPLG